MVVIGRSDSSSWRPLGWSEPSSQDDATGVGLARRRLQHARWRLEFDDDVPEHVRSAPPDGSSSFDDGPVQPLMNDDARRPHCGCGAGCRWPQINSGIQGERDGDANVGPVTGERLDVDLGEVRARAQLQRTAESA
jgi:hypothetical protein